MSINIGVNIQRSPNRINQALRAAGVNGQYPKLLFDFDDEYYLTNGSSKTFANAMTFARAGLATMVDSDGLIKWAPHNFIRSSEDFSGVEWAKGSNTTVTADQAQSPDGSQTADRLELPAISSTFINQSITITSGVKYTFSIYVKAVSGTSDFGIVDDITGASIQETYTATSEWQLITITRTGNATATRTVAVNNGGDDYASDIYIWGAHLYRSDLGGMVDNPDRGDSYVPTTSSAVYLPRRGHHKYNGDQWVNKGLLVESEARTNLLTYSNDFTQWTVGRVTLGDSTTSPDGTSNASKVIIDSGTTGQTKYISLTATVAAGIATYTFYLKYANWRYVQLVTAGGISTDFANFDLQEAVVTGGTYQSVAIENAGNDWYRYSVSIATSSDTNSVFLWPISSPTASRGASSDAGNDSDGFYIYGAQFEQASTPSSYIPTNGSTVTRAAETVTVPYANLPWPTPTYIGDELVTNGTFDTDISSWGEGAGGSISYDNGAIKMVTGSGTLCSITQAETYEVGKVYKLTFDVVEVSTTGIRLFNYSSSQSATLTNDAVIGTYEHIFVGAEFRGTDIRIVKTEGEYVRLDNISVREINPLSVSIAMMGEITYSDDGLAVQVDFMQWNKGDGLNYILHRLRTTDARVGEVRFFQAEGGTVDTINSDADAYSPDLNVPFNIAARHGSTFINGAVDGTALTADTTPVALPDLSTTNLSLAYDFMGTISEFRIWDKDIQDTGIAEATKPSLEPSLSLTFDGQPSSFTNTGLTS